MFKVLKFIDGMTQQTPRPSFDISSGNEQKHPVGRVEWRVEQAKELAPSLVEAVDVSINNNDAPETPLKPRRSKVAHKPGEATANVLLSRTTTVRVGLDTKLAVRPLTVKQSTEKVFVGSVLDESPDPKAHFEATSVEYP